jgi:hypothetical protein
MDQPRLTIKIVETVREMRQGNHSPVARMVAPPCCVSRLRPFDLRAEGRISSEALCLCAEVDDRPGATASIRPKSTSAIE